MQTNTPPDEFRFIERLFLACPTAGPGEGARLHQCDGDRDMSKG